MKARQQSVPAGTQEQFSPQPSSREIQYRRSVPAGTLWKTCHHLSQDLYGYRYNFPLLSVECLIFGSANVKIWFSCHFHSTYY